MGRLGPLSGFTTIQGSERFPPTFCSGDNILPDRKRGKICNRETDNEKLFWNSRSRTKRQQYLPLFQCFWGPSSSPQHLPGTGLRLSWLAVTERWHFRKYKKVQSSQDTGSVPENKLSCACAAQCTFNRGRQFILLQKSLPVYNFWFFHFSST